MKAKYNDAHGNLPLGDFGKRPRQPGRGRLLFWTIAALLILGGACYWLSRPPAERENLKMEAGKSVDHLLEDTPLAGLGGALAGAHPAPPPEVVAPQTEQGTLSGRQVTGTIAAPMDFGPLMPRETVTPDTEEKSLTRDIRDAAVALAGSLGLNDAKKEDVVFSQDYLPPVTEDTTVTPGYLESLARWLVNHYRRSGKSGALTASVQALNQECGTRLASSASGGRHGLLNYFFHPAMISGLYRMYIDRFMADLDSQAAKKGFTPQETQQFHAALAGRSALVAAAVDGVLLVPDLAARMNHIEALAQKTVDENAELTTAVFDLDELRQNRAAGTVLSAAQLRVEGANARYRRAGEEYARAQNTLAQDIRKYAGPGLDEETLLFIAAWAVRREKGNRDARAALQACATALRDLSRRCAEAGGRP